MRHTRIILLASVILCSPYARLHAQYAGGNGDGYSLLSSSDLTLDGADFSAKYHGGNGDGYSLLTSSGLALDGIDFSAKYRGGSGDGYALVTSNEIVLAIESITALGSVPEAFKLYQNYPNPFNPETRIQFDIPASGGGAVRTRVSISNIRGQEVRVLLDEARSPGSYETNWDGRDDKGRLVTSGVYLYTIRFGEVEATEKMLLVK